MYRQWEDDWTVVRRKRRPRQSARNRDCVDPWGVKDRAPPSSYGRKPRGPHPNWPVPPPRDASYPGPQSRSFRSYADVTRTRPRPAGRWNPPRTTEPGVIRESADPQLRQRIRMLYMVIRLVHHGENVAIGPGKPQPLMISRMVDVLADMIKPASPTLQTTQFISGNARNWGHMTCQILSDHYKERLEDMLEQLRGHLTSTWKDAFQVAIRWARRSLPNLRQAAVDRAEKMIADKLSSDQIPDPAPAPVPATAPTTTSAPVLQLATPPQVSVQTQVLQPPVLRSSVATMTDSPIRDQVQDLSTPQGTPLERRDDQEGPRKTRGIILRDETDLLRVPELPPEESRVIEAEDSPRDWLPGAWTPVYNPPSSSPSPSRSDMGRYFDELEVREERRAAAAQATRIPAQTPAQVTAEIHPDSAPGEDSFQELLEHICSPRSPKRFGVTRHPVTVRKLLDWNLSRITKKWVIMGDSNLSRFSDFAYGNLQVESFPGAHFRHIQALMEKSTPETDEVVVEKIVLAFGINSRANLCNETTVKNLQGAMRAAKRRFPYSEIWVPLVNFSPNLPVEERENLQALNGHIQRNMPFIPLFPEDQFQTGPDNVHWTLETADDIFDHWMTHMNLATHHRL